jgi:hypothetical protein
VLGYTQTKRWFSSASLSLSALCGCGARSQCRGYAQVRALSLSLYALWLAESSILDNTACLGGGRGQAQTTHRRVGAVSLGSLAGGVADSRRGRLGGGLEVRVSTDDTLELSFSLPLRSVAGGI